MTSLTKLLPKNFLLALRRLPKSKTTTNLTVARVLLASQTHCHTQIRLKSDSNDKGLSEIIEPIPLKPYNDPDGINLGAEITGGSLQKGE